MKNVSGKIYLCFAREDSAKVKQIITELEQELGVKLAERGKGGELAIALEPKWRLHYYNPEAEDKTLRAIEDSQIFVLFISNASKKSSYVKTCLARAHKTSKNILPIEIERIWKSPASYEFNFRTNPYNYRKKSSRIRLLMQLKATLGIEIEPGDNYGSIIHITTSVNAHIYRNGEHLGKAYANRDNRIRLKKGKHKLEFAAADYYGIRENIKYNVKSDKGEETLHLTSLAESCSKYRHQQGAKATPQQSDTKEWPLSKKSIITIVIIGIVLTLIFAPVFKWGFKRSTSLVFTETGSGTIVLSISVWLWLVIMSRVILAFMKKTAENNKPINKDKNKISAKEKEQKLELIRRKIRDDIERDKQQRERERANNAVMRLIELVLAKKNEEKRITSVAQKSYTVKREEIRRKIRDDIEHDKQQKEKERRKIINERCAKLRDEIRKYKEEERKQQLAKLQYQYSEKREEIRRKIRDDIEHDKQQKEKERAKRAGLNS